MATAHILGPAGGASTPLPLYSSKVSAGFPSPAQDHLEMRISLDDLLKIHSPHIYLVRVIGDSMKDIGLFDADIMVVDRSKDAALNQIVIASLNGEPFVKRYTKENNQIVLRAENKKFAPRYVMEGDQFEVWGVVTDSIRRLLHA